jgi:tetratricopeptide (TPR) repeat protein
MIQALKSIGNFWHLHLMFLEEAVPMQEDWILPVLVVVCDRAGVPLASPELMDELDQPRIENIIYRILEKQAAPDQLHIPRNEEWDEEGWREFSADSKLELRFITPKKSVAEELRAVTRLLVVKAGRVGEVSPSPQVVAVGLVRTALRLRSPSRKEAHLRLALGLDPDNSLARVELADIDYNKGNWKACLDGYVEVANRESILRDDPKMVWWSDRDTRPYLRALYGKAMTEWHLGRFADAAAVLEDLLSCNLKDNQGARFLIPMLYLLAETPEKASKYFSLYEESYPRDYKEPSFVFGWAFSLSLDGREAEAKVKYREGILRNLHIAPMLLELPELRRNIWYPNDRAEPGYASDFISSYATLWDREPSSLRLLREVWNEAAPRVEEIIRHRGAMIDFQDQRYEPEFKVKWQAFVDEDERFVSGS